MKCHFTTDERTGEKVLIPGCWGTVDSHDIEDCHCDTTSFSAFERKQYNEVLAEKVKIIKELEAENKRLLNQNHKLINKKQLNLNTFKW